MVTSLREQSEIDDALRTLREEGTRLSDLLMTSEMQLVEQLEVSSIAQTYDWVHVTHETHCESRMLSKNSNVLIQNWQGGFQNLPQLALLDYESMRQNSTKGSLRQYRLRMTDTRRVRL